MRPLALIEAPDLGVEAKQTLIKERRLRQWAMPAPSGMTHPESGLTKLLICPGAASGRRILLSLAGIRRPLGIALKNRGQSA